MALMECFRPHRRRGTAALAALALLVCAAPALAAKPASATLPLWRVSSPRGHTLYLVGSMHALKPGDYPLPTAIRRAFAHSDRLVEEIDLATIKPTNVASVALRLGTLAKGTLSQAMGAHWHTAQKLARKAGINLALYASLKPWLAGVQLADMLLLRAGYRARLGLDMHFAALASKRNIPITGLETVHQQLALLSSMRPALQRKFLLQTLREAPGAAKELTALHTAWRTGNLPVLTKIERRDFRGYPALRRRLLDARNRHWLPKLRQCLASTKTCFVVVGVEHMAGPDGLVALLRRGGKRVRQITTSQGG